MTDSQPSKEARILRMMKKVLTDIAKDTYTPPGIKHALSEPTIQGIRECLALITSRETELAENAGTPLTARPRFVDEPAPPTKTSVVVPLDLSKGKKKKD